MRVIETIVNVMPDGTTLVKDLLDIAPGEHRVVLVIDEQPDKPRARRPLRFTAYPAGPSSPSDTFRRENLYGDDGR